MPDSSYSIGGVRNEQQTEADRQRARMEQMLFQREMAQRAEAARNNELQAAQAQFNQAEENRRGMLDKDIAARTEATRLQTGGARDIAQMQLQAEALKWAGERSDKARETSRLESKDKARLYADPWYQALVAKAEFDPSAKSQLDALNSAYASAPSYDAPGIPQGGVAPAVGMSPQPTAISGQGPAPTRSVFAQDHPEVFANGSGRGATKATFRSDSGYTLPSASPYSGAGLFTGLRSTPGSEGGYVAGYKGPANQPHGETDIKRLASPDQMIAAELQRRVGGSRGGPSMDAPMGTQPVAATSTTVVPGLSDTDLQRKAMALGPDKLVGEEKSRLARLENRQGRQTKNAIYEEDPIKQSEADSGLKIKLAQWTNAIDSLIQGDSGDLDPDTLQAISNKFEDELPAIRAMALEQGMPAAKLDATIEKMKKRAADAVAKKRWTAGGRRDAYKAYGIDLPPEQPTTMSAPSSLPTRMTSY